MAQKQKIYIPNYISSVNYDPARVLPRLFFYNGTKPSETWYITDINNNAQSQSVFPYFDNYLGSETNQDSLSLLFNNEVAPYGEIPSASLYTEYWEYYVNLLYNPRTRILNASAIIPLAAYADMNLNDVVQFRGNKYHLRAINDYSLTTGECTIQLLGPLETGLPMETTTTTTTTTVNPECLFTFSSTDTSAFKLQIFTTASSYGVTLPTNYSTPTGSNFAYTASWGDGSITYGDSATSFGRSHTYMNSGSYEISITGTMPVFNCIYDTTAASTLAPVLTAINKWGSVNINNLNFYGCDKLASIPTGEPGTITWETGYDMFRGTILSNIPNNLLKYSNFLNSASDFCSFNNCLTS